MKAVLVCVCVFKPVVNKGTFLICAHSAPTPSAVILFLF